MTDILLHHPRRGGRRYAPSPNEVLDIMAIDVSETMNEYRVEVDLPGVKKDEIEITMDNQVLTITAEKKSDMEEKGENFHVMERKVGRITRSLRLPRDADDDSVRAQYQDGVLRVCIDRKPREESKIKTVMISDHDYPFAK